VPEWKDVLKKAKTADDKLLVICGEAVEASANSEMLEVPVTNRLTGDKTLYDYKSKFADLFEAHNDDTADWVGIKLVPIVPEKASNFFVKFEIADVKTENVE
jgi:cytochrome c oxidase assembly protein Cox11